MPADLIGTPARYVPPVRGDRGDIVRAVMTLKDSHDHAAIRVGLASEEFVPWFQPIVTLFTGEVVGFETLVCWVGAGQEPVFPDAFLPVAERTGLITAIDVWVTVQCLRRLAGPPISGLKLDRSLTQDRAAGNATSARLAQAAALAHELDLDTVAEGVESEDVATQLADVG